MCAERAGEVVQDKSQQLLDEIHGLNVGVDRLATAVEELTEVVAAAADIEFCDDPDGGVPATNESAAGQALSGLGKVVVDFLKQRASRGGQP